MQVAEIGVLEKIVENANRIEKMVEGANFKDLEQKWNG